jgi:hypothetical protein
MSTLVSTTPVASISEHLAANSAVLSTPASHPSFALSTLWPVVRPVLLVAEGLLFFQPTWANALKALVGALDALTAAPADTTTTA